MLLVTRGVFSAIFTSTILMFSVNVAAAEKYACFFDGGLFADFYVDIFNSEVIYLASGEKFSDFEPDFVDMRAHAQFEEIDMQLVFDFRNDSVKFVRDGQLRQATCRLAFNAYPPPK